MIGLILDNQSFEQDIRELLMAFYPGERFLHEENPDEEFRLLVRSVTGEDFFQLSLEDREHKITKTSSTEVDFSDRFETKNRIKRMLYGMAGELTGKVLPWGTLTGIRPVKIAMTKLLSGSGEAEVSDYMKDTYFTSDQKVELSLEIAKRELELLSSIDYEKGYSLYIGIPFCPTTCLYCSFTSFSISQWEKRMDDYLEALWKEMKFTAGRMAGRILDTVYVGGGTPTSLSAGHLEILMSRLKETFDFTNVKEFTVEAGRPDSITEEKLQVLKKYGVTRISINPQTMKEETLKVIGRRHTVEMVKDRFHLARSLGFDNINMDLIIGLPGEDLEDVRRTMEEIKSLGPDGITVHTLAIKRAARLNMFKEQYGDLKITGTQEMVDLTASCARSMGQEPYYLYRQKNMAGNFENVGYSAPGKACIYNILIMEEKQTIAACGAGTSTKVVFPAENRLERVENVKDVEQYIARIDEMIERKEKMLAKSEM
ncbi:coproporphyrinogen dehydrogenase HemZ [Lacrimispora amygdalina]|uniref:coproporphyrinogen dehydrogenase HemZ n=1 Tax=Lacrimispora amygdalina TaxID=253257 RepID=UPI000BE24B31|nr:coproporphyrinogen dehydrogenase HemZ [Lacrimispora amygdalina]